MRNMYLRVLVALLSVLALNYLCLPTTAVVVSAPSSSQTIELIPVDVNDVPEQFRVPQDRVAVATTSKEEKVRDSTHSFREHLDIPNINIDEMVFQDASVVDPQFEAQMEEKRSARSSAKYFSSYKGGLRAVPFATLRDGVSQSKHVEAHNYTYYKFTAPAAKWPYPIHIMVTPQYGDPDLFVSLPIVNGDDSFPNATRWTWSSTLPTGYSESVLIRPFDLNACHPNITTCVYYISVEAYVNTSFSITVRTGSETTELSNGVPSYYQYAPANNYTYYLFHNLFPRTNRTIAFSITASFGEPEIYVDDVVQTPTSENSRWRETALGNNVIGLTNCDSEYYYIGVKGSHNRFATYTILVHSYDIHNPQETATALNINVALSDALVFETFRYYYFHFVPRHDAPFLSVLSAHHAGETDLYLNFNAETRLNNAHFPNETSYQYRAITTGDNIITVYEPKEGFYYIGVKAKTRNSLYTIVLSAASDNTSNLNLIDGTHMPGSVAYQHHTYYQFYVYYVYDWSELAFLVTAHNGYGYMYLSDFDMHPQQNNYSSYNTSVFIGSQSEIILSKAKGNLHGGIYYLSVYGSSSNNFSYTITAQYTSTTTMLFGYSYSNYLSEEQVQFYTLTIPYKNTNATDVIVSVNCLYGFTRVYGSKTPNPSSNNYYWSSIQTGNPVQTLHIESSTCTGLGSNETCTIYIQVVATSDTSFSIMSYKAERFITINPGTSVAGSVEEGHLVFYQFDVDFDETNITVTVTPSRGDVSLYVSRSSVVDNDHYYYSSVHDGTATETVKVDLASTGYYYVAVYGVLSSAFNIKFEHTNPVATDLNDGKPVYNYMSTGTHHFYKFVAPSKGYPYPLEFSVRPEFGDPDLYVHLQRNTSDNTLPVRTDSSTYDWRSTNGLSQVETVVIFPSSTPSCFANTTKCTYFISVYAYSSASYYITARTGASGTELINGVSTPEHYVSTNEYQYYMFNNEYPDQNRTIAFALTAYYGEPTIYIDDNITSPTSANAKWRETALGSNVVGLTNCNSEWYYIGIKGGEFSLNRYSLVVHSYDPNYPQYSATSLSLNQPIADILVFNTWRYYTLYLTYTTAQAPPELAILVSRRVGEPFLYVAHSSTYSYTAFPNATYYDWKSTDDGSNIVSIANPSKGYYFIGVRAEGHNTQYQIAAAAQLTNTSSLSLVDGTIYPGFVRQGYYSYYQFRVPFTPSDTNELSFVVTPLHGRCGIYVSDTVSLPTSQNSNWSSTALNNEVVVLTKANGRLHTGTYYMGVYGFNNCSYSVVASYTSRYTFSMGSYITGYLREEGEQFMSLSIPMSGGARDFTLTLSTTFGSAYLYVHRSHDPNRGEYDWEWASYTPGAHAQTVQIPASACSSVPRNGTCNFYILVFGVTETNYLIHAIYANESRTVTSGQTVTGSLALDDYAYYKFNVPADRMNVTIRVTPTSGNPDLYLNRYSTVNADEYVMKSETNGAERIYFDWTTEDVQYENGVKGFWYIAVYARTACSYSLVVTIGNQSVGTITLSNGQPVVDDVIPNETRYYQFTLSKSNWPYTTAIEMTRISGYATMVVVTPDNTTLTADEHGFVEIDPSYSHACNPTTQNTCLYRVRITGYSWGADARYILTYTTGILPAVLVSGVATSTVKLGASKYNYYMIPNPTKGNDIMLALNVLSGNPIMYVSVTEMYPSATKRNWTSTATNRLIGLTNQQYPIYYVAVLANNNGNTSSDSVYSLIGRSLDPKHPEYTPTYLSDGYQVTSLVNANVYDYFVFYVYPDNDGKTIDGFTISVTPKTGGTPAIYMDAVTDFSITDWPTKSKHTYNSQTVSGNIVITVPKASIPNEYVEYRIGVLSSSNAQYTITAMAHGGHTYIGDGYEINNYLEPKQYHYYNYYLYSKLVNTSWSVSVTSTTGNARLYVSDTNSRPTIASNSYNWSSIENGVNIVRLTYNSGNIHTGYYYIGVYCASTAYESRLGQGGTRHVKFRVQGVKGQGSADVNLWELVLNTPVGRGQLFVGTNGNKYPEYDDSSSYTYSSKTNTNVQRLAFSEHTCDNGRNCDYYIQIYCPTSCFYQITAASAGSAVQLVPGTPAKGQVAAYGIYNKIYRFNIPSDQENVTLTLQMDPAASLASWPHMYVGLNNPDPTQNSSDFETKDNRRVQTLYFDYTSPVIVKRGGMQGNCFVSVYYDADQGNHETIPFTLALKLSEAIPETLTRNEEAAINLKAGGTHYYQFFISNSAQWPYTTSVTLRVPSGAADMYVNSGLNLPSRTSFNWKVENVNNEGGSQSVVVVPTDSNACIPDDRSSTYCTYTIFVVSRSDASIRLTANYQTGNKPDPVDPDNNDDGGSGNGAVIAVAVIVPLVAIVAGIAIYFYCCRGRSCNWSRSSSSKQDDFYDSHIEMNEAGSRSSKKSKFGNRLLDDADSDYGRSSDDSGSYRPPRL
jgi:hypothetical protein